MACPGNQHCVSCIDTLAFPMMGAAAAAHPVFCPAFSCNSPPPKRRNFVPYM